MAIIHERTTVSNNLEYQTVAGDTIFVAIQTEGDGTFAVNLTRGGTEPLPPFALTANEASDIAHYVLSHTGHGQGSHS